MQSNPLSIQVVTDKGVELPFYATEGAAGMDIRAHIPASITLEPAQVQLIPTGLRVAIPKGYEMQIRPRSGMAAKHQVIPLNTPGTIDSDYRGEVKVILMNLGQAPFTVEPGMRIAQMVVAPYCTVEWKMMQSLEVTERGEDGFGGTGYH